MRQLIKMCFFALLSCNAIAAKDPISWQQIGAFPAKVATGGSYNLTYTFTNQLPLQLAKPLVIEKLASSSDEFSYVDNCTGLRLNPQQACTVSVRLNPVVAGSKSITLVMSGYDNNRVPLPSIVTNAVGQSSVNKIHGSVSQPLPGTMSVGVAANYSFLFTNSGDTEVEGVVITSNDSNFTTNCANSLESKKSCTVSGTYTPSSNTPNVQSVNAKFSYTSGNPVTLVTSTSIASISSGVIGTVVSPNYLPAEMVGGPSNQKTLQFLFTNYNTNPVTITSRDVDITGGNGATFEIGTDPGDDSCSGSPVLVKGAACQILGTFTAPTELSPTGFTVTASVDFTGASGSPSEVFTATTVVATIGTSRTINLVNECDFSVWFSLNGGALAGSPNCSGNPSVCPTGTSCDVSNGICFWDNYAPDSGSSYELAGNGGTNSVTIPLTAADSTIQWSGNISASTLCNGTTSCGQADCQNNGGSTACAVGKGFSQPATQAEITMLIDNADSYDVEVINGFHLPISMAPGPFVTPNNYTCGIPGDNSAGNGFGACDWDDVTPPSNAYYWVTSGGASCNVSSPSCGAGSLCGLDSNLNQVCGNFLGFWTANQACAVNATTANTFFNCNASLPTTNPPFPASSTLKQLMACSVPTGDTSPTFNSCYLNYPAGSNTSTCCGCVDWWTLSIGANNTAQSCTKAGASSPQTDPQWTSHVQPTIQWLKSACPSIYTYQFDDATSGFGCSNNLPGEPNSVGYTITFCPGGVSGLPAGITDGR